jgi:hypothetical protein
MLDHYVQALTKELELEGSLATQVPGVFQFPLEQDLRIEITDRPPGFRLSCTLGRVPQGKEEEFYTRCLLGNLFGQGTKGAVLGLNEDGTLLTLAQDVDYNAEYKEFRDILEDFINTVDYWREEAQRYEIDRRD